MMNNVLEKQVLSICERYRSSELYDMVRERVEYLITHARDSQAMADYLKEQAEEYYSNDPFEMLGFLDTIKELKGNLFIPELQLHD